MHINPRKNVIFASEKVSPYGSRGSEEGEILTHDSTNQNGDDRF